MIGGPKMRIENQNMMMLTWNQGQGGRSGARDSRPEPQAEVLAIQFVQSGMSQKSSGLAAGYGPRMWRGLETRGRFVDQVV